MECWNWKAGEKAVLELNDGTAWKKVSETEIDVQSFTALFRVENWDDSKDHNYRVAYDYTALDGKKSTYYFRAYFYSRLFSGNMKKLLVLPNNF